jgi:hypothetical protein
VSEYAEKLPNRKAIVRDDVYGLEDADLAKGLMKLLARPTELAPLTAWEKSFCQGAATSWAKYGALTWKQRKTAREVLIRVLSIAVRFTQTKVWLHEEFE